MEEELNSSVVEISQGLIKGSVMQSSEQKRYLAFRGIPYAEPPVEDLRFKDPIPAKSWLGIQDATKEAPACLQYEMVMRLFMGQEDCLYLNVYTPKISGNQLLPVLVWIHGGAWIEGTGNGETFVFGPDYFMDEDIVLITINYRLTMFGFLSTDDEEAPGNYGLLDQILALKWVQNNIEQLGGNPKKVTIFGESAGGAAVHHMMLSPLAKGLFHGAVSQSGTAMHSWATIKNPRYYATELGKALNCKTDDSKSLISCLREVDGMEIIRHHDMFKRPVGFFPIPFGPRVDRERQQPVIPDESKSLLEQGKYHPVPWMTGVTKNEGAVFFATQGGFQKLIDEPELHLPYFLNYGDLLNLASFTRKVLAHYFKNQKITHEQIAQLIDAASDSLFNTGLIDALELHAQNNLQPIYVYQFSHRFNFTAMEFIGYKGPDLGVTHTDDLLGLFRIPNRPLFQGDDKKISKTTIKYLVNFATTGDPNGNSTREDRVWLPVNEKKGYLDILLEPQFVPGKFPFEDRVKLWSSLSLNKQDL